MNYDDENDFYVVIPSNVESDDNPTCFSTFLAKKVELRGLWQVGMRSIYIPHSWKDSTNKEFIRIYHSRSQSTIKDPPNFENHVTIVRSYLDIPLDNIDLYDPLIAEKLTILIRKRMSKIKARNEKRLIDFDNVDPQQGLVFKWDIEKQRYYIVSKYNRVFIPTVLSYAMGFDENEFKFSETANKVYAKMDPHYISSNPFIYVYANIVDETLVGSSSAQLLQIIPVTSKYGGVILFETPHPNYINCNTSKLKRIEINITNDKGECLNSHFGTSVITLHFIKKSL